MIFHGNSLHCKGPILDARFWAERMVVLRSSAPSRDGTKPTKYEETFFYLRRTESPTTKDSKTRMYWSRLISNQSPENVHDPRDDSIFSPTGKTDEHIIKVKKIQMLNNLTTADMSNLRDTITGFLVFCF